MGESPVGVPGKTERIPGFEQPFGPQVGESAFAMGAAGMVARNIVTANQSRHFFTV